MKAGLSLAALLLAGAAAASEMDRASYEKLVAKLKADGEYVPPQRGEFAIPPYFTLKKLSADPKGDHTAKYLSVMGMLDVHGVFHMTEFRFVDETWKDLPGGVRRVDQWLIGADIHGRMTDHNHNERLLGTGKPASDYPLTREAAGRKFLELVKLWAD